MELDILFWLAIGAIYLFQMFAGRNKRKQVPGQPQVPGGPTERHPGSPGQRPDRRPSPDGRTASDAPSPESPTLQDALREISDILSGRVPADQPSDRPAGQPVGQAPKPTSDARQERPKAPREARPASTADGTSSTSRSSGRKEKEFRSPLKRKTESAEDRARRLAELKKTHRTHRTKPLGGERSDAPVLNEDVFERRSRPPRSSTYDDLFESPLYESFGDPIDHKELKVEILEPRKPAAEAIHRDMRLSKNDARRGIILSEILGPPVSRRKR